MTHKSRYLLRFKTLASNKIKNQLNSFFFTSSYDIPFAFNLGLLCYNPVKSSSMCLKKLQYRKIYAFLKLQISYCFQCFFLNLLPQCGDIDKNPGPKYSSLIFCHWNLNRLTAHDCVKITLIQAYITDQNFDIVCLSDFCKFFHTKC